MITRQINFLKRVIAIVILLLLYVVEVQSQALTTKAYGIWDRAEGLTESQISEADFVLGFEIMDEWRDIQNNGPDSYDFSLFQNTIDKALKYNRLVKVNINVGEDSPQWLYTHGVPKGMPSTKLFSGINQNMHLQMRQQVIPTRLIIQH